jgi:hypothetical protein
MTEFRTRIIQPTVLFALISSMVVSCARAQEPGPAAASTPEAEASEPPPELEYVAATLMFTDCETVSNSKARVAQSTMRRLVEACTEVPGGTAQFTATLLPGGRIELTAPDGGLGTVPTCVLRHELRHKVAISKPCTLQVQMSQKKP